MAAIWLALGLVMIVLYFVPLFSGPLYSLNGPDIIEFLRDLPEDKIRSFDKLTGILMLIVPIAAVFIGFLSLGFGALRLKKASRSGEKLVAILSLLNLAAGSLLAIKLTTADRGWFDLLMPQPEATFYILLVLHAVLIGTFFLGKEQPTS